MINILYHSKISNLKYSNNTQISTLSQRSIKACVRAVYKGCHEWWKLFFSDGFIMSLITAQRWAGLLAVKLTSKLFHVWTLCSDAALSTCLFILLSL